MFIIDTDVFVSSKNGFYSPNFCPHFWDLLIEAHANGLIFSIDKVRDELLNSDKNDYLASDFMSLMPNSFWLKSEDAIDKYLFITEHLEDWLKRKGHKRVPSLEKFLTYEAADAWIIAKAIQTKATVITFEKSVGEESHQIKIPDVCNKFDVSCINPFDFLKKYADKSFKLK